MMDRYLAQCADEAFKALLTDEDLETRLNTAAMHLGIPNDSQVDTASQDVMESLPFSSPDEFPTPRNLSACFFDLNDRQAHGQYHKMPCPSPWWRPGPNSRPV